MHKETVWGESIFLRLAGKEVGFEKDQLE